MFKAERVSLRAGPECRLRPRGGPEVEGEEHEKGTVLREDWERPVRAPARRAMNQLRRCRICPSCGH